MSDPDATGGVRLDVWLWRARFFKTRATAGAFIRRGRLRIARGGQAFRATKPHTEVAAGDVLTFARGGRLTHIEVRGIGARRGPPAEARALYADAPGPDQEEDDDVEGAQEASGR